MTTTRRVAVVAVGLAAFTSTVTTAAVNVEQLLSGSDDRPQVVYVQTIVVEAPK